MIIYNFSIEYKKNHLRNLLVFLSAESEQKKLLHILNRIDFSINTRLFI